MQSNDRTYALTERGWRLLPALGALANWGLELMDQVGDDHVDLHWLRLGLLPLAAEMDEDLDGSVEVRSNGQAFHLRVGDGQLTSADGASPAPDAVVQGPVTTLVGLVSGRSNTADPALHIIGDRELVDGVVAALRRSSRTSLLRSRPALKGTDATRRPHGRG